MYTPEDAPIEVVALLDVGLLHRLLLVELIDLFLEEFLSLDVGFFPLLGLISPDVMEDVLMSVCELLHVLLVLVVLVGELAMPLVQFHVLLMLLQEVVIVVFAFVVDFSHSVHVLDLELLFCLFVLVILFLFFLHQGTSTCSFYEFCWYWLFSYCLSLEILTTSLWLIYSLKEEFLGELFSSILELFFFNSLISEFCYCRSKAVFFLRLSLRTSSWSSLYVKIGAYSDQLILM